jgi:hypothetical protein
MYSYFCSNGCYNDFANKYIQQVIAIAPRTEPLETPIDRTQKVKHENDYHILMDRNKDNRKRGVTTLSMDHASWSMVQDRITERNI